MTAHKIYALALTTLLLWVGHSQTWAAPDELELDGPTQAQDYVDVPVEAIQEFVQIYGIVKDNYVTEKSDDALFQQAIRGLVSGLDRYSRYLTAEEYKQLLQYTEGDLASVDFNLRYEMAQQQWVIQNLNTDADSAKQGLRNGDSLFKIDDQELRKLTAEQVNNLLTG
ncbi:MAG: S41 family peptidase, partial [Gammaproteobacteria bacterium]|nr:S41 family peptidase [Gammaproteobacteria bacterium]